MHEIYEKELSLRERREKWKKLIGCYRASHLTQKEFAKVHGLKSRDLPRWIWLLNRRKKLKSSHKADNLISAEDLSDSEGCENFVEVNIESKEGSFLSAIRLTHESGFSLEVKETTDEFILKKVLKVFKETSAC